ncbi:MAG: CCA tRNA nucleotidyltransferase [Haloarculaceae archaeon]
MSDAGNDREAVLESVRERVTPDAAERAAMRAVVDEVTERAEDAVADLPVEARICHVGSTARDTWLAGDRDVDVFVCFPPDLDRESLEEYGLGVGEAVLPEGRQEFAEHPYVVGEVEGFEVDLVPCYDVAAATDNRSAVDRTPFHAAYLEDRIDDAIAGEVRLCKQFLTGVGCYGSDLKTRGFSGFLAELLVLEYGDFPALLRAAADWHPPVRLDPADHGTTTFEDPLVVADPTDPDRNVAAVLSATNLARFQHYARDLLTDPRVALFEATDPGPLDIEGIREHVERRGTTPVAVRFEAPDVVDDQLWPQLRTSLDGVADELQRRGFDVLRRVAMAEETGVLLVELAVAERPAVERHEGPPVHVRDHAERFVAAYAGDSDVYGPFVDGDRYVVERERAFTTAVAFLESDALFDVGLGVDVKAALEAGYDVLAGSDLAACADEFGVPLARYFDPTP